MRLLVLCWLLVLPLLVSSQPAPPPKPDSAPGVLVMLSTGYGQAGIDSYVKGLYEVLRENGVRFNRIHIEYLDLVKNPGEPYRHELSELLLHKYSDKPLRAIVTMQPVALEFLLKEARQLAPEAPALVAQARLPKDAVASGRSFHLQTPRLAFAGTLERALELFPRTRIVYVLSGSSAVEQERLQDARRQFQPWMDRMEFRFLDDKAFDAIEHELAQAPADSVVIAPGVNRDARGQVMVPVDSIVRIAKTATAPVFPVYAGSMGQGPIGGMVSVLEDEGRSMAQSVLALLAPEPAESAGFAVQTSKPVSMFDWRQIERWGGDWSRLPPDTVYLHRPPSLWGQYRGYVIGTVVALAALSALALALAMQSRRRLRAEIEARSSQSRYQLLADNMSDVLWVINMQRGALEYLSPSAQTLLGHTPEFLLNASLKAVMDAPTFERFEANGRARAQKYGEHLQQQRRYVDVLELIGQDGRRVWTESVTHFVHNAAGELVMMGVTRDISQRMQAQAEINRLAFYDGLTQLPNRKLLQDRAQQAMAVSARSQRYGGLLFIDLDHFKTLNDTRGHEMGDQLLQQVAGRLTRCVRAGDTVARLGGDEFVVLLEELNEEPSRAAAEAKLVGDKVLTALEPVFMLNGVEHAITASIGVTLFVGVADSYDELLKRADLAMYRAKSAGRNGLCFYDPEMQSIVQARAALELDLRRACSRANLCCTTSPRCWPMAASLALKPWCVGRGQAMDWSHPLTSFPWRRRAA